MAMGTEEIPFFPIPFPGPSTVDPGPPVPILLPVALTTKAIGLFEGYRLAAGEMKLVSILCVVAVEAPAVILIMVENDV